MTALRDVGEYELLNALSENVENNDILIGPGTDDCAVKEFSAPYIVQSSDFVSSRPLSKRYGRRGPKDLANFLFQANLSDILSTGAVPSEIQTLFAFPESYSYADFLELIKAFNEVTTEHDVTWSGGDIGERDSLHLAATITGYLSSESQIRTRSGAEPGDKIIITGDVGEVPASAFILENKERFDLSDTEETRLLDTMRRPTAPLEESLIATENEVGNGGMDISDGLGIDLNKLATHSDVGLVIEESKIPTDSLPFEIIAERSDIDPTSIPFTIGGDWQILLTMPPAEWEAVAEQMNMEGKATNIGEVIVKDTAGPRLQYVREDGTRTELPTEGHELFAESAGGLTDTMEELIANYGSCNRVRPESETGCE